MYYSNIQWNIAVDQKTASYSCEVIAPSLNTMKSPLNVDRGSTFLRITTPLGWLVIIITEHGLFQPKESFLPWFWKSPLFKDCRKHFKHFIFNFSKRQRPEDGSLLGTDIEDRLNAKNTFVFFTVCFHYKVIEQNLESAFLLSFICLTPKELINIVVQHVCFFLNLSFGNKNSHFHTKELMRRHGGWKLFLSSNHQRKHLELTRHYKNHVLG